MPRKAPKGRDGWKAKAPSRLALLATHERYETIIQLRIARWRRRCERRRAAGLPDEDVPTHIFLKMER